MKARDYLIERLSEASTWRGIMAFLTAMGVAIQPDQVEVIVTAGLGIIGVVGMVTQDKPIERKSGVLETR